MTAVLAGAGVGLAWLGGAVMVLADGRRGLAAGLLVAAAGVALALAADGAPAAAAPLAVGGAAAALGGLRLNPRRGWGLLQAPSTPRVVMALVLGGAALWLGLGLLDSPGGGPARAAALIAIAIGAGRLLGEREPRAGLTAAALVALGAGAASALAGGGLAGALLGAVAAVALSVLPAPGEEPARVG